MADSKGPVPTSRALKVTCNCRLDEQGQGVGQEVVPGPTECPRSPVFSIRT